MILNVKKLVLNWTAVLSEEQSLWSFLKLMN